MKSQAKLEKEHSVAKLEAKQGKIQGGPKASGAIVPQFAIRLLVRLLVPPASIKIVQRE